MKFFKLKFKDMIISCAILFSISIAFEALKWIRVIVDTKLRCSNLRAITQEQMNHLPKKKKNFLKYYHKINKLSKKKINSFNSCFFKLKLKKKLKSQKALSKHLKLILKFK